MTQFPLEKGLTASLWDLFAAQGPVDIALAALYRQLPHDDSRVQQFKAKIDQLGSQSWLTSFTPGPDLGLVTSDDDSKVADVLAIIEIKANAQTNWPKLSTALELPELPGDVATAIKEDYFGDFPIHPDHPFMCQTDLYRSRKWWKSDQALESVHGVRLTEPEEVLWLLFDTRGRTPEEAFGQSSNPGAWLAINLKLFAAHLRELRSQMPLTDAHRDTIAVVLWHIDQANGENLVVTTSLSGRDESAPSITDIAVDDEVSEATAPSIVPSLN